MINYCSPCSGKSCGSSVGMSEIEEILFHKIECGHLRLRDGVVEHYETRRRIWHAKKSNPHPVSGRARYVFGKNRTSVYANRLIWMIVNKRPIPDGCVVDHKDGDRKNDRPDNLSIMNRGDSDLQGNDVSTRASLDRLCRWFEFVGNFGREPCFPEEVTFVEVGF